MKFLVTSMQLNGANFSHLKSDCSSYILVFLRVVFMPRPVYRSINSNNNTHKRTKYYYYYYYQ